ncbi:hypothetical protein Scep_024582 [Stephania cephalantha]|uniref:Uncharacterized protein n=1 Tax=Stephania cephalantha TaxID=152367 RepID=A0AAP0EZP8_9MAGN
MAVEGEAWGEDVVCESGEMSDAEDRLNGATTEPTHSSQVAFSPSTLQAQVFDEKANCSNLTLKKVDQEESRIAKRV